MNKQEQISIYAEAIKLANQAAIEASKPEDGGTCNMDTPVIDFTGWRQADIDKVIELSGIRIGDKLSGFFKGCRWVRVTMTGQGNNRSRMAEAACKKMKELGLPAMMYSQMD